jgi:hypothetical protein
MEVNGEKSTLFTIGLDEEHVIEFGRYFPYQHPKLNDRLLIPRQSPLLSIQPICSNILVS